MEPSTIDAVSKLGFPIFAALSMGYAIWRFVLWAMNTGDRLAQKFETHVDTVGGAVQSIKPQLDRIEGKIDDKKGCKATDFQVRQVPA